MDPSLPEGWTVRDVTEDDLDALHGLRLRALTEHPDAFGSSPSEHPDPAAYRERHRQRAAAGTVTVAAFPAEGDPVGMASMVPGRAAKERHKGSVYAMYVAPEARGRGVGEALLAELIDRARQLGLEQLILEVSSHNPARRLYERAGFVSWGVEPHAAKYEGRYFDGVWMILWLDAPEDPAQA